MAGGEGVWGSVTTRLRSLYNATALNSEIPR